MILQERIELLEKLGQYLITNNDEWQSIKERAQRENPWFTPEFIDVAAKNIAEQFLNKTKLQSWMAEYDFRQELENPKKIGVVMAGNIPLVGFHDFLCVFITGHQILIKTSSKDDILIKHLVQKLINWKNELITKIEFAETLKNCDAYIATGSNNSGRLFEYYFGKYPNIIRKNRTSVAVLKGDETSEELSKLAQDIQLYYGLGCRNITKLFVPKDYNFVPLLDVLKEYDYYLENHKYKHNYDYHLALLIMGNKYYMNNGSIVFTENESLFSPISQVHYEFYDDSNTVLQQLKNTEQVQCIEGKYGIDFGQAQQPQLMDYADGVDTIQFLLKL